MVQAMVTRQSLKRWTGVSGRSCVSLAAHIRTQTAAFLQSFRKFAPNSGDSTVVLREA